MLDVCSVLWSTRRLARPPRGLSIKSITCSPRQRFRPFPAGSTFTKLQPPYDVVTCAVEVKSRRGKVSAHGKRVFIICDAEQLLISGTVNRRRLCEAVSPYSLTSCAGLSAISLPSRLASLAALCPPLN